MWLLSVCSRHNLKAGEVVHFLAFDSGLKKKKAAYAAF
jgi:hypothetical protein